MEFEIWFDKLWKDIKSSCSEMELSWRGFAREGWDYKELEARDFRIKNEKLLSVLRELKGNCCFCPHINEGRPGNYGHSKACDEAMKILTEHKNEQN